MSIYATGPEFRLPVGGGWPSYNWVGVYIQFVPAHIGQPSEGYDEDLYDYFLPPIVSPYPSQDEDIVRAVVFVQNGRERKEGQQYVDALLTLTYDEYKKITFMELWTRLYEKIDPTVVVQTPLAVPDGFKQFGKAVTKISEPEDVINEVRCEGKS